MGLWTIIFGVLTSLTSIAALMVSVYALNRNNNDKYLKDQISLALSDFRQKMFSDLVAVFANRDLYDEKFKGIEHRLTSLEREAFRAEKEKNP